MQHSTEGGGGTVEAPATAAHRRGGGEAGRFPDSIETGTSWIAAAITTAILSISYGAPLIVVVGLKPIGASLGADRALVALAASLVWLGTGMGGIPMGWIADRIGVRPIVIFGALMSALGLAVSATGRIWALFLGHAALIGLLGNAALFAPLVVYVTRWFDRRRGLAVALISSGQYIAGIIWPSLFERGLTRFGWQATMLGYAAVMAAAIVPLALFLPPAAPNRIAPAAPGPHIRVRTLGLPANLVQTLICLAGFLCCVPMAMPATHLVAFCSSRGIPATQGAAMLSVLFGCAFLSRVFWGWFADRVGGLGTVFAGSACQAVAMVLYAILRNEAALFVLSAAYGLGFSGIIPGYIIAIRELFPSSQASWRVPALLFTSTTGMAFGGWLAGALYDSFGYYSPAFAAGALFNLANLLVIGFLVAQRAHNRRLATAQSA